MNLIMITCPHCSERYLAMLQNQTEKCPVCHNLVTITVTPGTVEVKCAEGGLPDAKT